MAGLDMLAYKSLDSVIDHMLREIVAQRSTEEDETSITRIARDAGYRVSIISSFPHTNMKLSLSCSDVYTIMQKTNTEHSLTAHVLVLFHKENPECEVAVPKTFEEGEYPVDISHAR